MNEAGARLSVSKKFCGENDRIMPGKPCENCTCGRKEMLESKENI